MNLFPALKGAPPDCTEHPECQPCQLSRREEWPYESWWLAICEHHAVPAWWKEQIRRLVPGLVYAYSQGADLEDDRWVR